MRTAAPPKRMRRSAAARYLGVPVNTLARWAVTGRPLLRYYRYGRTVVYDLTDLDAFLEKHRVTPEPQS